MSGILDGIAAINDKMLHRDVKPDNILMSGQTPRIADFGLSKIIGTLTRTRTFKGGQQLFYMAPEGWKNEKNTIQLDMYSVGIVAYELASLRYPYTPPADLSDIDAFRQMHLFSHAIPLDTIRADLPLAFCHWVQRLLAKRPDDRFPNWNEAQDKFQQSWTQAVPSSDATREQLMASLLETFGQAHEEQQKRDLERARIAAERDEWTLRNQHQREVLVENLKSLVEDFNKRSSLGTILLSRVERSISSATRQESSSEDTFKLPNGGTLVLQWFEISPPLDLKKGKVRFAALLALEGASTPNISTVFESGGMCNYLLVEHSPDDFYGTWIVCEVSRNALVRHFPMGTPDLTTFGFGKKLIREIEKSDRAMHIFTLKFDDDIRVPFVRAITEVLSAREN